MYFSINDDTLSNRLVDDLKEMERTLTVIEESELSSVINTQLEMTTKDEQFFQENLQLKLFPNQRSQCSTPKIEVPQLKLNGCSIPDLVLPLTTVLEKIEKKVTIMEPTAHTTSTENKENQENVQEKPAGRANLRKSLKPRDGLERKSIIPAKKPTLRKSMIPNAPPSTATATGVNTKGNCDYCVNPVKSN